MPCFQGGGAIKKKAKESVVSDHIALNIDTHHRIGSIGTHRDRLLDQARESSLAIVGHRNRPLLARSNRVPGRVDHRATTRSKSLMNNQRPIARIRKHECIMHLL